MYTHFVFHSTVWDLRKCAEKAGPCYCKTAVKNPGDRGRDQRTGKSPPSGGKAADSPESRDAIQMNLHYLVKWAD